MPLCRKAGPSRRNERGFTLLELMVAVAILALITGIAFPQLQQLLGRTEMVTARSALGLAVARARSAAITSDGPVNVSLDNGRIVFTGGLVAMQLPQDVQIEWPQTGVVIYGDGSAQSVDGVIRTRNSTSRFTIDADTARISFAS